ncbi:MAG: hypothetical protein MI863_07265 [Desulfobacterales bacterium]|nr:hypothetical protein [Desulfobacterales bacterium]
MKITDPEVIKSGEKDLIDSVQEDLDLGAVREILKERMAVAALASKGGQIVVHDNQIAFRLDFEVNLSGSLLFDRDGNFIDDRAGAPSETETASEDLTGLEEEISLTDGISDDDLDLDDELREEAFSFPDSDETESSLEMEEDSGLADSPDETDEEDLPVDLPDYDLDEEISDEMDMGQEDELELSDMDEGDNLLLDDGDELTLDDEEDLMLDPDTDEDAAFDGEADSQDLDDDINDILKESREFWEQKKDS